MAEALALDGPEEEARWNAGAGEPEEADLPADTEEDEPERDVYAVSEFLTHECEQAPGDRIKAADLFAAYQSKAGTRSREATNFRQFGQAVAAYGIASHRHKTGVRYLDVRLASQARQEAA